MPQNGKRPTMDDVAARAGVSRGVVSKVIRGDQTVTPWRRDAVAKAVDELGYRPNAAARLLAQRPRTLAGVVLTDLNNPFTAELTNGLLERAADSLEVELLFKLQDRSFSLERCLDSLLELRVGAIIICGNVPMVEGRRAIARAHQETHILVVSGELPGVDIVRGDDEVGAALVASHFSELGHRRVAHIDGGDSQTAQRRRSGFVETATDAGLEVVVVGGDFTHDGGRTAIDRLLDDGNEPSAVFAANDVSALGAMERLIELGRLVPGDISIAGYDNIGRPVGLGATLTSVDHDAHQLGRLAMSRVLDLLLYPGSATVNEIVQPRLVAGSTTTAPATG